MTAYEDAIRFYPEEPDLYLELSEIHDANHHREDSNEVLFRWAGRSRENYDKIVKWFLAKREMDRIKGFLKEARLRFPENVRVREIENILKKDPRQYSTPLIKEPPDSPFIWGYSPTTVVNYRKLADILAQKNIKLVSVQYPVRTVAPLQIILEGKPVWAFVDNEESFQSVLKRENFQDYFFDRFGRQFGHCTAKGNQLLAENVARVILEKIEE